MKKIVKFYFLLLIFSSCNQNKSQVPDFKAKVLYNDSVNLKEDFKNKVSIVNTWFIGCHPCMQEMPTLNVVFNKYKSNKSFSFYSVAANTEFELQQFFDSKLDSSNVFRNIFLNYNLKNIDYPILIANSQNGKVTKIDNGNLFLAYSEKEMNRLTKYFKSNSYPTTILYNKEGIEVYRKFVFNNKKPEEFKKSLEFKIDSLLKE